MSPTEIMNSLKRRDPVMFEGITRETIKSWIDRTGEKPQWKDSIQALIDAGLGNQPGHNKGGRHGILVR